MCARLYVRHLALFLLLAGLLVVPFDVILLVIVNSGHASSLSSAQSTELIISGLVDVMLVIPVVSALQVHAVALAGEGESPHLGSTLRRALPALPVVVAASIIAAIGFVAGLVLLVLPGIWLWLRLYVVAQTAAIEGGDWPTALRRSFALTRGSTWRVLGLLIVVYLINLTLQNVAGATAGSATTTLQDIVVVVIGLLSQSFSGLLGALLYFDLRAREAAAVA